MALNSILLLFFLKFSLDFLLAKHKLFGSRLLSRQPDLVKIVDPGLLLLLLLASSCLCLNLQLLFRRRFTFSLCRLFLLLDFSSIDRPLFFIRQDLRQSYLIELFHLLHVLLVLLSEDHRLRVLLFPPQLLKLLLSFALHLGQLRGILILDQVIDQVVQICVNGNEIHISHRVTHHGHLGCSVADIIENFVTTIELGLTHALLKFTFDF